MSSEVASDIGGAAPETARPAALATAGLPGFEGQRQSARRPLVRRLQLTEFRSYQSADLAPDAPIVALTGANGVGKTNLLEALSLLAPGRGMRRANLAEMRRWAAPEPTNWAISALVELRDGARRLGTGMIGDGGDRRVVRIDGVTQRSQAALAGALAVAWLTPAMDGLFREGAGARRRMFDRLVYALDEGHAERVAGYDQAMRERNRLLADPHGDRVWLAALEETMARLGVAIAAARLDLLDRLAGVSTADTAPFPAADLAIEGRIEARLAETSALDAEDAFRSELGRLRAVDAAAGGATIGPHRSDLVVTHRAKAMAAAQCSTGEQKALLIALQIAHARVIERATGAPPLLLLDEVTAHLDAARRGALFEILEDLGGQAWLTGTERDLFAGLGPAGQFFTVADGAISAE